MKIKEHINCRVCDGILDVVLDLGYLCPSNFVKNPNKKLVKAPLVLTKCNKCNLVQLKHTVDLDSMYRQYWYKSSLNSSMLVALKDIVKEVEKRIELRDGDIVVDIGCNTGSMLTMYSNLNLIKVGFDPALNLKEEAEKNCTTFINDYFSASSYSLNNRAKVVTSIAMFYDLESPNIFIEDVKSIMHESGLWVIQLVDLVSMLKVNEFSTICVEHLETYSLEIMINLLKNNGLEVFDVSYNDVNGGSIRLYISFPNKFEISDNVIKYLKEEQQYMNSFTNSFLAFSQRIENIKLKFVEFIKIQRSNNKIVMGLGASTKANTLLQYFNIDSSLVKCIGEVNKDKFGLFTSGSNIPIVSEEEVLTSNPDYIIVFTWQFRKFFEKSLSNYINKGGKVIFPLPNPEIVSIKGVERL